MPVQLTLFSVDDRAPTVGDVEGLLLAGGALVRRADGARISVVVDAGWRAGALTSALVERGLGGEQGESIGGQRSVRTDFDPRLLDTARRWTAGARIRVPRDWALDSGRLRMWAIAGGRLDQAGYLLRVGPSDEHLWDGAGAVLSTAGVAGAFLGVRAGGPAYRIVGTKRLTRLREMLGDLPTGCPADSWPR